MGSVILVMYPNVEHLVDAFGGQGIGASDVAVFPGSQREALRAHLHQQGANSSLTIIEIADVPSMKVGMMEQHPDGREVLKTEFPTARSFF